MTGCDVSETMGAVQPGPALTYASVCSGIEAASAAWEPLGWKCLWLCETDRAAGAVLAHHFPDVPNLGDLVTLPERMLAGEIESPDVLIGGTPCQPFSIAGLRGGMADARGALTLAFVRLADAIDARRAALGKPPVLIVWENVPGVLTHKENPFGCFLGALAGESMPLIPAGRKWTHAGLVSGPQRTIAWRIFDAQYFGLAQRRNRVFVVASADSRTDPGAILFEREGVRRDSPPRREAGEKIAGTVDARTDGGGFPGTDFACAGGVQPVAPTWWDGRPVSQTLDAVLHKGQTMPEKDRFPAVLQPICFSSKDHGGDAMHDCSPTLRASGHASSHANAGAPPAVCVTGAVTHPLRADGFDGSEDGTGRGQPITVYSPEISGTLKSCAKSGTPNGAEETSRMVAYGFQPRIARNGRGDTGDIANALVSQAGQTGKGDSAPCVAFTCSEMSNSFAWEKDVRIGMRVRRLMPVECERLQGFPDHWTLATARNGRPVRQADGPRYKQLGNSMPVPVIRWLGVRIAAELTA